MSNFKNFLDKVLAPIRGGAGAEAVITVPKADEPAPPPAVSEDELERRYVEVMNALFNDAKSSDMMRVFTDVVTWKLAVVGHYWGPAATADVVRRLGAHLASLAEAEQAQREADAAKEAGHRPN